LLQESLPNPWSDEGHIPQDPAISLLWIAFVRTREKGVRVTSDQRIIALLDNLFVFFRLCRHFLLPPLFFIRYFLESCASRSGYWMCRGGMEFPLASDARLASYLAPSLLRLASNGRP
jgi:hypothetical protein